MYVKLIERKSNSPVAIVKYQDVQEKRDLSINLRNIKTMEVKEMKSFTNPWIILEVIVWRKKERIEQTKKTNDSETAPLWIDCETKEESEEIRIALLELHKKVCKCCWSSGIHEGPTVGRGELSDHGYWQFPCYLCAREAEKEHGWKNVWPWSDEYLAECEKTQANKESTAQSV